MTFSNINTSTPNSGLGDKLRDAFNIVNYNFSQITGQVSLTQLNTILGSYSTITYVNAADTNLQLNINGLIGSYQTLSNEVDTLQTDLTSLGLLVGGKASLSQLNDSIANINSTIAALQIVVDSKISDAPKDGTTYGRRNGSWTPVVGGGSTYKVYSATVIQGGGNDFITIYPGDFFEIGRTYRIHSYGGSDDFTNIGAIANVSGMYFVATGTTPAVWNDSDIDYIVGTPVFNVLENTIGNVIWRYNDKGDYSGFVLDTNGDPVDIFFKDKTPTLNYFSGDLSNIYSGWLQSTWKADNEIRLYHMLDGGGYQNDFDRVFIEIRVYN